jgi:Mor family transcriptional regulator
MGAEEPRFKGNGEADAAERELVESLPGDLGRIAEVAGLEAALRIARAFRGTYIYVPGLDAYQKQIRDTKIRRDYDGGISVRVIAEKYGIAERTVWRVLKSPPDELYPFLSTILDEL